MTHTRRRFLASSAGAAGAAALGPARALAASTGPGDPILASAVPLAPDPSPRPLSILILGGTGFIGPHQVRYAMYRGHQSASSTAAAPPRTSSPAWRR